MKNVRWIYLIFLGLIAFMSMQMSNAMALDIEAVDGTSAPSRPVNFTSDYADEGLDIDALSHDSSAGRAYGWMGGHVATGQGGNISHNTDFAKDSSTSASTTNPSNLGWGFKSARLRFWWDTGNTFLDVTSGTVTINDTATNYIEFNLDSNAVQVRSTRFTENYIALHIVRRDTNRIVGETDVRWAMPIDRQTNAAAVPASATLTDFGKDTGATSNTDSTNYVVRSGFVRTYKYDTAIRADSQSVALIRGVTNYLQMDAEGRIVNDTQRFRDTAQPHAEVRTSATGIVQETSHIAWYQFGGNARIHVGLDTEKSALKDLSRGKDLYWATNTESLYIAKDSVTFKNVSLAGQIVVDTARNFFLNRFDSVSTNTFNFSTSSNDSRYIDLSGIDTFAGIWVTGEMDNIAGGGGATIADTVDLLRSDNTVIDSVKAQITIGGGGISNAIWPFSLAGYTTGDRKYYIRGIANLTTTFRGRFWVLR